MRRGRQVAVRALPLAFIVLVATCLGPTDPPGVPLYPNAATTRLPRSQVAALYGQITLIDGQSVAGQGGVFELLPGCHFVELERRMGSTYFSRHIRLSGEYPAAIFALRMKAGARYVIRRDVTGDNMNSITHIVLTAREEAANGAVTDLEPVKSDEDLKACKGWEATALTR